MNRPQVITLNTASLDGRLTLSPDALLLYGDQRWQAMEEACPISGSPSLFAWLKSWYEPGATLEGSGSFLRNGDEPEPLPPFEGDAQALYQDFLPKAVIDRPGHRGWFTAVDGRGRIRWLYKDGYPDEAWQGWHALVLAGRHTPAAYLAYLRRENIPYLIAGGSEKHVDLKRALEKMKSRLGVSCVLSTAGGKLNGALLRAGLVDEINLEILPAVIGGFETPALFDAPDLESDAWPVRLKLISAQVQGAGRLWLRYQVDRE